MLLTLHRINVIRRDNDQAFIFSLENAPKLFSEPKGVESESFNYGGTDWSLVCARKDENHLGVFLKWRYSDACSAGMLSTKCSFSISVIHQHISSNNATFSSQHQVFSSSQMLLGKSKFLPLRDFLDPANGYLDGTARQAMIELRMSECSFGFESVVDVSTKNRNRKNAGGIYFDTTTFFLANHRWYLRFYTKKLNSGGLPAVYLYLHGGSQGVSLDLNFVLILGNDRTEKLKYEFGEGAKFDGFGKTLPDQFTNPDKLTELNVSVEITGLIIYKLLFLKLPALQPSTSYSVRNLRKSPISFNKPPLRVRERIPTPTFNINDLSQQVFQDQYGNPWKVEFARDPHMEPDNTTNMLFEKGVYHYQNNKSKLVCIQISVMSQNLNVAQDIAMCNPLFVCYFSNSLDEKGYPIIFPVSPQQLAEEKFGYLNENGEVLVRIEFLSVQTSSFPIRSGPKFDYLINHQSDNENTTEQNNRKSLKDMTASRASLSILDERPPSDSSGSQFLLSPKSDSNSFNRTKSVESLLSSGHSDVGGNLFIKTPPSNSFLLEFIQCLSGYNLQEFSSYWTGRLLPKKSELMRGDIMSTTFDEASMLKQAKCDLKDEIRQKEMLDILVSFLEQKFPLRVSEIVLLGSLGTGTTTSSRCDVDLVVISSDLPKENHNTWLVPLLQTLRKLIERSSIFEPSISSLNCTNFFTTKSSLQFTCDDMLDVDVWICRDWSSNDYVTKDTENSKFLTRNGINHHGAKYNSLLEITGKYPEYSRYFEMCSSQLKSSFFGELPLQVKEYIKVVKNWRNSIIWTKFDYRPDSYLISLLVIKAVQELHDDDLASILQKIGHYLTHPELRITWDVFYKSECHNKIEFEPPTPLVRDPTNPAINVAGRLKYWGEFKMKFINWINYLKINNRNTAEIS